MGMIRMPVFDQYGNLILPSGAMEEFRKEKQLNKARYPTGVFVGCPRCGSVWERKTRNAGEIKCSQCHKKIKVGEIL